MLFYGTEEQVDALHDDTDAPNAQQIMFKKTNSKDKDSKPPC